MSIDFWIVAAVGAVILRLTSPVWILWLHRRERRWLRKNGRPMKTWEQLHPNDMVGIVPGMMVEILAHPKKRNAAVVTDWGERQAPVY